MKWIEGRTDVSRPVGESCSIGDVHDVTAVVSAAPEVRIQIVESLRARTLSGSYCVSGSDIVDRMVRRAVADRMR